MADCLETLKARGLLRHLTPRDSVGQVTPAFPYGLGETGVHEIVEASYGDMAAVTGFALAVSQSPSVNVRLNQQIPLLWISQHSLRREHGHLLQSSALAHRPSAAPGLFISTRRTDETLWCLEECLRAGAAPLVVAELQDADFTASRRLALAAQTHGVCALLLMPHGRAGTSAALSRWRIAASPSSPNQYDAQAPGHARWTAMLERCRTAPHLAGTSYELEFNDETLLCDLVPELASGQTAPRQTRRTSTPAPGFPQSAKCRREIVPFRRTA